MISIRRATVNEHALITRIGLITVDEAHRDSCSRDILKTYLDQHYNESAIKAELNDAANLYSILYHNETAIGFSKIIPNTVHATIPQSNVTKLDRIYLLKEFHHLKLGWQLLQYNIDLAKAHAQTGLWLFTWVGNAKAINFYLKAGFEIIGSHQFQVTETHYNDNHHMFLDWSKPEVHP